MIRFRLFAHQEMDEMVLRVLDVKQVFLMDDLMGVMEDMVDRLYFKQIAITIPLFI
jgi:hypothetical protein